MTTLNLPRPPSVNNLFGNAKNRGRYITPTYREWRKNAGWALKQQRPEKIVGPVTVEMDLAANTRGDPDNYWKATLDLLVEHQVIEGDGPKIIKRLGPVVLDASVEGCRLRIEPI